MSSQIHATPSGRPLDELDRRQDEVLAQIDRLDADILALLKEFDTRPNRNSDEPPFEPA